MGQQIPAVERAPLPIGAEGAVDDHQVGVQQRILSPADPVGEPDRQQPRPTNMLRPTPTPAGPDLPIQVRDRGLDPALVRLPRRPAGTVVPEGIQHRHVLDRAQHQIPSRHRIRPRGAAELLTGLRVPPVKHPLELLRRALAAHPQRRGTATQPLTRGLALPRQVLLAVAGDLAQVVVGPAGRQLVQVRRHPLITPASRRRSPRAPGTVPRPPAAPATAAPSPHRSRPRPAAPTPAPARAPGR
jgi:hypothetical protein